jgi:hypothetical protein
MREGSDGVSAGRFYAPSAPDFVGWLQAGSSSFAYRLAHLSAPRPLVAAALGLLLVFI